jgi:hypothetical protein
MKMESSFHFHHDPFCHLPFCNAQRVRCTINDMVVQYGIKVTLR